MFGVMVSTVGFVGGWFVALLMAVTLGALAAFNAKARLIVTFVIIAMFGAVAYSYATPWECVPWWTIPCIFQP